MTATVTVNDIDRSSYLVSSERVDEYCNPGVRVHLVFDTEFSVDTWESVILYENGTKVFTGTVVRLDGKRKGTLQFEVIAKDAMRRLREYFVVEDYVTEGEGVKHWIGTVAGLAGCSINFVEDYDVQELAGMTLGKMFAWEIIDEFLLLAGWDIWCNADGDIQVGFRARSSTPDHTVAAGDNLASFERSMDSEPPRNAAMVYSVMGTAYVHHDFGWEIDSKDVRVMVVSSVYIDNIGAAATLANRMLSVAGPTYDIKSMTLDAVDTDMEVGDKVDFDDGEGQSGVDDITTIASRFAGTGAVQEFDVVLGERCPKVGAGGVNMPLDGRDVIVATYESGVWRCKDIWEGTPHWESLNSGLVDEYAVGEGSTFKCEWFIRDPYQPNDLTYLLTQAGILYTASTEPGLELWLPRKMNSQLGANRKFTRIRSTVARQGAYFYTVMQYSGQERNFAGLTNDGFNVAYWEDFSRVPETQFYACITGSLWGNCNYGHQKTSVGPRSWHPPYGSVYATAPGAGGLAAWHKTDGGCTATGVQSATAANGGPAGWNCERESGVLVNYQGINRYGDEILRAPSVDNATVSCWFCYGTGHPLDPPCTWGSRPYNDKSFVYNAATSWLKIPTLHIPYNQKYAGTGMRGNAQPEIIYYSPGQWEGSVVSTWAAYPTRNSTPLILPWGSSPALCHILQGSIGTHSQDRRKVYCFSFGSTSRFAVSIDEGATWAEKGSVPFGTSCFSGFPTSASKVYAGRDPSRDPSAVEDTALIYVTWDKGDTWTDVTGDLWTQTQALGKRPGALGTAGLVTIAPRYC